MDRLRSTYIIIGNVIIIILKMLERAGEKSAVDCSDPVCSFILHHLRPKSSGHVTQDSHNLQTEAINHSTRHYMNRRELESDHPIHVPLLRLLSFPPSDGLSALLHSRAAHATPSNHTQGYTSCICSELRCYSNALRRFVSSTKPFKRQPAAQIASIRYGLFGHGHCVG